MVDATNVVPPISSNFLAVVPPPVSLPQRVEQLLNRICAERNQPQPDAEVRRELASLSEDKALDILTKICNTPQEIRNLSGFIVHMIHNEPPYSSPSLSPSNSLAASRLQTQSEQHGGVRPPDSYASPSKAARTSCFQGPSSARPSMNSPPPPQDDGQAQLEALGELEFRRQFLILNYAGGMKLENIIAPETIRSWKDLPMQLFETKVWEALGRKCINKQDRQLTFDWDSGKTHIYHCYVSGDGSYTFKGPYLNNTRRTLLQKILADDSVLIVKFADIYDKNYGNYSKVAREVIHVGLRRYQFFVFKDGGSEEKKKSTTSSGVKCYFVRVASNASIDRGGDYKLSNRTIDQARRLFMHAHTVSSVSNYMIRFSLILSKTSSLEVDWSLVNVETIDDQYCLDESGNRAGKPLIHTDGTGFISKDLASLCPKDLLKRDHISKEYIEPLLMQCRLYYKGHAVKGTFLVNKTLPPNTIQIRPSMVKVKADPSIFDGQTVNSLEIVGVGKSPVHTYFSRCLIALLCHGGVPKEYFMERLMKDLKDAHGVFSNTRAALRVAVKHGEIDDDCLSAEMISCGIPLEESYLQHRLSVLMKEENNSLKRGKFLSPQSYCLMGTADPTGILKKDEVCIIHDSGHILGDVLVYRHPGLHFGDIHVLKARHVQELESVVGNAKCAIFFSCQGPRSIADEMGGGDFDGDLYWVSKNPRLLECFKLSEPWIENSSTPIVATIRPDQLSNEDLEDELFKLFLKTTFQPSFAMSEAFDNWMALMDRFLTLGPDSPDEKTRVKEKMLRLVDIYYDALNAPKKGRKVEVPRELKATKFPHYMERKNSYHSTSILGEIYDTVDAYQTEDHSAKEVKKLTCFDVEVPDKCLRKWKELYHQEYMSEMNSALQYDEKEGKSQAANDVIRKYKVILYGGEDFKKKTRPKDEIFDEALAIYHVCYDHAMSINSVGKCSFAWKVAGSALCKYYSSKSKERYFRVSHSVLKDIL